MCGIAGVFSKASQVTDPVLAGLARDLSHRGPDGEGIRRFVLDGGNALGLVHRRLAIIDLSEKGSQPMADRRQTVWITYNGQIYNYRQLKAELREKGFDFHSDSDTEVVLCAYLAWGCECLKRLEGMFAFCIWDRLKKKLFLAIDRLGIKPLYFFQERGAFLFASELRALVRTNLVGRALEPRAVNSFLAYGAVQSPLTMIKGIQAFLPGTYCVVDLENEKIFFTQYWRPFAAGSDTTLNEKKAAGLVESCLEDTVKKHLVADVPVGVFLSGGTDSSIITSLSVKENSEIRTFSVVFPEAKFSEQDYSRCIAREYKTRHTEIPLTQDQVFGSLSHALDAMDQPSIDGINVYAISEAVSRTGIKVVLSGQGGDEVFGGYSTFARIPFLSRLNRFIARFADIGKSMRLVIPPAIAFNTQNSKLAYLLRSKGDVLTVYQVLRELFGAEARRYLIRSDFLSEIDCGMTPDVLRDAQNSLQGLGLFSQVSSLEMKFFLANMLLRDGDCMSMAHGLEVRVPFLDHTLIENVGRIPDRIKSKPPRKSLLLKAAGRFIPKAVHRRPKQGFVFPWQLWLKDKMRKEIEETIRQISSEPSLGLDSANCSLLWKMFLKDNLANSWSRVWAIYVLAQWYKKNIAS